MRIISTMTLEEVITEQASVERASAERAAQCHGACLEEALLSAQDNDCLTVGVYESAKIMNL